MITFFEDQKTFLLFSALDIGGFILLEIMFPKVNILNISEISGNLAISSSN